MTRAAIFDLDGTLVDTMPVHYEAYRRTFAELDLELSRADFYSNIGGKASETIPKFLRGRTCRASIETIHRRKQAIACDLLSNFEIPKLACAELLPLLRGVMPVALASSGSRSGIEVILARFGWTSTFDVVLTGDDVVHGKPAPDIFLRAAGRLSVDPVNCTVFEDTDDGVSAARAAGMHVFDVRLARPT